MTGVRQILQTLVEKPTVNTSTTVEIEQLLNEALDILLNKDVIKKFHNVFDNNPSDAEYFNMRINKIDPLCKTFQTLANIFNQINNYFPGQVVFGVKAFEKIQSDNRGVYRLSCDRKLFGAFVSQQFYNKNDAIQEKKQSEIKRLLKPTRKRKNASTTLSGTGDESSNKKAKTSVEQNAVQYNIPEKMFYTDPSPINNEVLTGVAAEAEHVLMLMNLDYLQVMQMTPAAWEAIQQAFTAKITDAINNAIDKLSDSKFVDKFKNVTGKQQYLTQLVKNIEVRQLGGFDYLSELQASLNLLFTFFKEVNIFGIKKLNFKNVKQSGNLATITMEFDYHELHDFLSNYRGEKGELPSANRITKIKELEKTKLVSYLKAQLMLVTEAKSQYKPDGQGSTQDGPDEFSTFSGGLFFNNNTNATAFEVEPSSGQYKVLYNFALLKMFVELDQDEIICFDEDNRKVILHEVTNSAEAQVLKKLHQALESKTLNFTNFLVSIELMDYSPVTNNNFDTYKIVVDAKQFSEFVKEAADIISLFAEGEQEIFSETIASPHNLNVHFAP
jgi:hypothetical protein